MLVATVLIPLYKRGGFVSAYQYLGERFGRYLQGLASITFVVTRLLAEGVRLFASAIPIKLLLDEFGVHTNYKVIIAVLTLITVVYTYLGGIKAVIWTDAIQMGLYVGGAMLAIGVLLGHVGTCGVADAFHAGKFKLFDTDFGFAHVATSAFALPTAIIGGAIFAMASHGSDQLIVQRILSTRTLRDGQKAMIGSGIFVAIQFAAFSLVGALLWSYNDGKDPEKLGLATTDNLYPKFILHGLPVVISGLLVAGILGAAMGSLSSALNSMSNSTVADIVRSFATRAPSDDAMLRLARVMTLVWAVLMAIFAAGVQRQHRQRLPDRPDDRRLHVRSSARCVPARPADHAREPARRDHRVPRHRRGDDLHRAVREDRRRRCSDRCRCALASTDRSGDHARGRRRAVDLPDADGRRIRLRKC